MTMQRLYTFSFCILLLTLCLTAKVDAVERVSGEEMTSRLQVALTESHGSALETMLKELLAMLRGGAKPAVGGKRANTATAEGLFPKGRLVKGSLPIAIAFAANEEPPDLLVLADEKGPKIYSKINSPQPGVTYLLERAILRAGTYRIIMKKGTVAVSHTFDIVGGADLEKSTQSLMSLRKIPAGKEKQMESAIKDLYRHGYIYDGYVMVMVHQWD